MDVCRACETQLMDGITKCPKCGASLVRPGAFLQVSGWVLAVVSLIPLSVGAIAAVQKVFAPMIVGLGFLMIGTICIIVGKLKMASSPATTLLASGPKGVAPQDVGAPKGGASSGSR